MRSILFRIFDNHSLAPNVRRDDKIDLRVGKTARFLFAYTVPLIDSVIILNKEISHATDGRRWERCNWQRWRQTNRPNRSLQHRWCAVMRNANIVSNWTHHTSKHLTLDLGVRSGRRVQTHEYFQRRNHLTYLICEESSSARPVKVQRLLNT